LAGFKLSFFSVVLLPLLPDRGFGPWQALNAYRIWWIVALIAAPSYVGYLAVKLMGSRLGLMVTGVFGGLASSTATAIELARHATEARSSEGALAGANRDCVSDSISANYIDCGSKRALRRPLAAPLLIAGSVAFAIAARLAGLADVDSITLSLATMAAASQTTPMIAIAGILLAAVNTLIKPGGVIYIRAFRMGRSVALLIAIASGALGFFVPAALG
jgi:uncharacterized membrane protein (DUF4010 family)